MVRAVSGSSSHWRMSARHACVARPLPTRMPWVTTPCRSSFVCLSPMRKRRSASDKWESAQQQEIKCQSHTNFVRAHQVFSICSGEHDTSSPRVRRQRLHGDFTARLQGQWSWPFAGVV
eukprot:1815853-Prymnesium_polylepis.2